MKEQMETEMRQFFDMKMQKEHMLKQSKRQFATNHYQDVINQGNHHKRLSSIKMAKS
jgi:hypothetical protein